MKKVANLERLLAEERQKVTAVEKRLQLREESQAQQDEHSKMHSKEMSVIQQEVKSQCRRRACAPVTYVASGSIM